MPYIFECGPDFFVQTYKLSRDSYIFVVLLQGHPSVRRRGREGGEGGWLCNKTTASHDLRVWNTEKKLYWCSVRLLPKLFYIRWSYVAHRFKLAWAIWTVKSCWDNTWHTLIRRHSQILLPYECAWMTAVDARVEQDDQNHLFNLTFNAEV